LISLKKPITKESDMKKYMHQRGSWIVAFLMLFIASTAKTVSAATTACPSQYLNGVAPDI